MLNHPITRTTVIPIILRLTLAAIFIYHGVSKIAEPRNDWGAAWATQMWLNQGKVPAAPMAALEKEERRLKDEADKLPEGTEKEEMARRADEFRLAEERIKVAYSMTTPLPDTLSYAGIQFAVAWGELLGGVALLLGALTRAAAVGLIIIQVGAIVTVTWAKGFSDAAGAGYEYNLAIVAMCLVLIIKGAGPLSIDEWWARRRAAAPGEKREMAATA